jgi:inositol phosphorylceramide synthase catalytic subunit
VTRGQWARLRVLWPGASVLLPAPFLVHGVWVAAGGRFRWDNAAMIALVLALFLVGPATKKLLLGVYPLGMVAVLYDAMKTVQNVGVTPSRIHVCDLRALEIRFFGVSIDGQPATVHDWFQVHSTPLLDTICAVPYGTFLMVSFACAVWLYFHDYPGMLQFTWSFLALNLAAWATYHLYPAAPPWYFHTHGCLVDVLTRPSAGPNLTRVDGWLGVPYFAGMYGRASSVFGAMPSLHVAYALLIVMAGWATFGWRLRSVAVLFFLLMAFSAAYLDHHWVLDILAGILYCAVVAGVARRVSRHVVTPERS